MGNANQLFKDDEEERVTGRPSDDQLRHITGINHNDEAGMEDRAKNDSATVPGDSLDQQEKNPDGGFFRSEQPENKQADKFAGSPELRGGEQGINAPRGFFKREAETGSKGLRNRLAGINLKSRKSIAGIAISALLGGGGFFGLGVLSGPFQLMHLSQILGHSYSKLQSDSSARTEHLFRYARAYKNKNVGYTRVGLLGSKIMNGVLDDLAKNGITIKTNVMNQPTEVSFDRATLEKNFPETKGMSETEFKSFLADKLSDKSFTLDPQLIENGTTKGTFKLGLDQFKFRSIRRIITNGQIGIVGDGEIEAAIKTRPLKKFFGLGSLFHPFSTAIEQRIRDRIAANTKNNAKESPEDAAKAVEDESLASQTDVVEEPGIKAAESIKSDMRSGFKDALKKVGGGITIAIITGCTFRDVGKEIITVNRNLTVLPAIVAATNIEAKGSQVEASDGGISLDQVGATVQSLTDKSGHSAMEAAPIILLSGGELQKKSNGELPNDLPNEYGMAFNQQSTAQNFERVGNDIVNAAVTPLIPKSVVCNPVGYLAATALGLAWRAAAIATAPETGGLSVALTWGASRAIETGIQIYLVSSGIKYLTDRIVDSQTAGKLAKDAFSGPAGGALLAYGARAGSDLAGIASGGISIANNTSTFISDADRQQMQSFKSESFYARVFDTGDYRSLTGHITDSVSPSYAANIQSFADGLQNVGSALAHAFGSLLPRAHAASTDNSWSGNYDWGFPQYGIPQSMLNDPTLADPYANANSVATYLNDNCKDSGGTISPDNGDCGGDSGITARIKNCFGNDLTYDSGVWDVAPASNVDVDPNSDTYINAHCDDLSDQNWKRLIMFINDTSTMKSIACYNGDETSCDDLGAGASNGSTSDSGGPVTATGTSAELAQKLLDEWGKNLTGNSVVKSDLTTISKGQTIKNSDSCGNAVSINADLLQVLLTTTQKYKLFLDNIVSGHGCDQFLHPKGRASDIGQVTDLSTNKSTNFCAPSSNPQFAPRGCDQSQDNQQLDTDFYTYIASIMPKGSEMGQHTCAGRSTVTEPAGVSFFGDFCDHQHIDVGNP